MRDELTQKEYESFINELAGKELSKKEQVKIPEYRIFQHAAGANKLLKYRFCGIFVL